MFMKLWKKDISANKTNKSKASRKVNENESGLNSVAHCAVRKVESVA